MHMEFADQCYLHTINEFVYPLVHLYFSRDVLMIGLVDQICTVVNQLIRDV